MSIWKVSNLCFNSWSSKQSNWQCYQTTIRNLPSVGTEWLYKLAWWVFWDWGGVYMRKLAQARVSYCNGFLISYRVYWMTSYFISRYLKVYTPWWENTCVIQSRKHYACATRCSLPADRFHTKCVVVSHWNDTVVMFRTGVNFSPRYIKQGELTPEAPHMRGSWTNADELTFTCHY